MPALIASDSICCAAENALISFSIVKIRRRILSTGLVPMISA